MTKVKRICGWMRERKPPPQRNIAEENTEGRKQVKASITTRVSSEASKPQWFLCWHMMDRLEGWLQPDLFVSSVHQFPQQLDRNTFLNPKLTHKVSFWLSGNEGKWWMGKPIGKKPHMMKTMSIKETEHMSFIGFGKPRKVLYRW